MDILFRRISTKLSVNHSSSYFASKFFSNKYNQDNGGAKKNYFHNVNRSGTKILIGGALLGFSLSFKLSNVSEDDSADDKTKAAGLYKEGLPFYTQDEISKHKTRKDGIWVTYKHGVYDVTNYIKEHPGGEDLLMQSAGISLEPFWAIYQGHEDNPEVYETLESFRIGNVKVKDGESCGETPEFKKARCDYFNDPERSDTLNPLSTQPYVGGPVPALLVENYLTPQDKCFIHNHMPVPNVDLNSYELTVEIKGKNNATFTLDQLKGMPATVVTATIQCASNRSVEMAQEYERYVQGPAWDHNAIYNAEWKGVLLIDVLKRAGYDESCECNPHVQFQSIECNQGVFSTSIPLWRAKKAKYEVLLAYEMNGQPLTRDHGYPLRVIIPGVSGTRWVKCLEKISMQDQECQSKWHQHHYRMLDPSIPGPDLRESMLQSALPVQEMPVTSAICKPLHRQYSKVKGGQIQAEGYAWSGGGQKIARVEVSSDRGKTWTPATIINDEPSLPPFHWTWAFWNASVPIEKGQKCVEIWARATDSACNTQPEGWTWNFGGVACNAIHKVRVYLE